VADKQGVFTSLKGPRLFLRPFHSKIPLLATNTTQISSEYTTQYEHPRPQAQAGRPLPIASNLGTSSTLQLVATTALIRFGFSQACYELDDSSDCSSDSEDDCHSRCSEDDEDYDRDRNTAVNNGEPQESGSPQTIVDLPSAIVVDDDLRRAADIPLPPSPAPVLNSPLEVPHPVQPSFDNGMDIDTTEQPSEPPVQVNDSIHPHTPAIPHGSTATAAQSSCPSSPPSKKVNEEEEVDACFDISPEQKRQRALDKGKGRAPHDDPQEAPVAVEPLDTTLTTTDQQEQETKKTVEEEVRCPTPTPAVSSRRRYRPILTTRSSHGWVWNQVCILFTPPAHESHINCNMLSGTLCPNLHERPLHCRYTRAPKPHIQLTRPLHREFQWCSARI
jgi:hypothetical protein